MVDIIKDLAEQASALRSARYISDAERMETAAAEIERLRAQNVGWNGGALWEALTLIRDFAGSAILVRNDALDHVHVVASVALKKVQRDAGSAAVRDVLAERRRQVEVEGYAHRHDDSHSKGELALAAACYAKQASDPDNYAFPEGCPADWPWSVLDWKWTDPRRDLVKAVALGLAEIERLDRAAALECGLKRGTNGATPEIHQPSQ